MISSFFTEGTVQRRLLMITNRRNLFPSKCWDFPLGFKSPSKNVSRMCWWERHSANLRSPHLHLASMYTGFFLASVKVDLTILVFLTAHYILVVQYIYSFPNSEKVTGLIKKNTLYRPRHICYKHILIIGLLTIHVIYNFMKCFLLVVVNYCNVKVSK